MEREKIVKIITVSAIIFIVLLAVALILNLVKLTNINTKKANLEKELEAIERRIDANESEIERISTDDYIDRYAREYLNMQGKDEQAFTGKE